MLCLFSDTHKHLSSLGRCPFVYFDLRSLIQVVHSLFSRVGMKGRRFIFSIFFPSLRDGKKVYLDINEFEKSLGRLVIELIFPIFLQNSFKHDIVFYNPVKFPNHFHSYFPIFSSFEQKTLVSECLVHGWNEASRSEKKQKQPTSDLSWHYFAMPISDWGAKANFFWIPFVQLLKPLVFI